MADSPKPPKRGLLARVRNFLYRTPVGVALHRPTPQLQASDDDKKRTSKIATGGSAECGADEPEPGHATLPNMTEEDDSHPESGSPNEGATNDLPLVERHNGIPEATNVIDSAPHREHPLTIPPATKSGPYEHQDRVLAALRNSEGSLYGHMMPTLPEMYEKELSPESSDNDEKEVSLPSRDEDPIKTAYIADSMTDAGNLDLKQRIKEKTSAGPSQAPAMEELSPPAAENTKELKNKIDSMIGELKDQIDQRTSARNAESCRYFADENAQPESTTPGVHVSSSPVDTTKELEDKVNRMISDLRKKIEQNILAEFTETSEALAHKKSQPGSTSLGGSNVRHQIPMQDEELVKLPEHEEKYRKPSSCGDPKIEVTRQQRLGGLNRLSKAVYAFMENVVRTQTLRPDKRDQETFEDFLRSLGDPVLFEAFRQMIPELNWDQ